MKLRMAILKPRFTVGDRVKVRVAKDVIKENDIICDIGFVRRVDVYFNNTPLRKRITYTVRLDGTYCRNIPSIGVEVQVSEGFNVNRRLCSIKAE